MVILNAFTGVSLFKSELNIVHTLHYNLMLEQHGFELRVRLYADCF